jgi:hypothetical protein
MLIGAYRSCVKHVRSCVGISEPFAIPALTVFLVLAVFLIDVATPNGIIDGFLYASVILHCSRARVPSCALCVALLLMPLMALGFLLSPTAAPIWIAVVNRLVAAGTVWTAAIVAWRNNSVALQREEVLAASNCDLERALELASDERQRLYGWLHEYVEPELTLIEGRGLLSLDARRLPTETFARHLSACSAQFKERDTRYAPNQVPRLRFLSLTSWSDRGRSLPMSCGRMHAISA